LKARLKLDGASAVIYSICASLRCASIRCNQHIPSLASRENFWHPHPAAGQLEKPPAS
jgi:hypothetical protein